MGMDAGAGADDYQGRECADEDARLGNSTNSEASTTPERVPGLGGSTSNRTYNIGTHTAFQHFGHVHSPIRPLILLQKGGNHSRQRKARSV